MAKLQAEFMITERTGIWATLLVAIGTAVAAYAKVKSDTAVALEKVDTVAETIRRLDQKIEVINTTALIVTGKQ